MLYYKVHVQRAKLRFTYGFIAPGPRSRPAADRGHTATGAQRTASNFEARSTVNTHNLKNLRNTHTHVHTQTPCCHARAVVGAEACAWHPDR